VLDRDDIQFWKFMGSIEAASHFIPPLAPRMIDMKLDQHDQAQARLCYIAGRGNSDFTEVDAPIMVPGPKPSRPSRPALTIVRSRLAPQG
jgi:hypothetical protein